MAEQNYMLTRTLIRKEQNMRWLKTMTAKQVKNSTESLLHFLETVATSTAAFLISRTIFSAALFFTVKR